MFLCHDPNPTGKYESIHHRYFYREHDDYIIQTLDVGTFAPFGNNVLAQPSIKKSWNVLRRRF